MEAAHRRWAGRFKVVENTVWEVTVRAPDHQSELRTRCLKLPNGAYTVQHRTEKGWEALIGGNDPRELLGTLALSTGVKLLLTPK